MALAYAPRKGRDRAGSGAAWNPVPPPSGLAGRACLALARSFLVGRLSRIGLRQRASGRFESAEAYVGDRRRQVDEYAKLFSRFCDFGGKAVLDLGSSSGYLLADFLERANFTAIGADINPSVLVQGEAEHGSRIRFVRSTASRIPLDDASVDVVYSIDTFEHLSRPEAIVSECHRVLRPGGLLLVHFHPWLGPYGSHLDDIITFPWAHVVFSLDTLLKVAAHLYESDAYTPACYWIDQETGQRRPNPFTDRQGWQEFLNRMTIRRFRRLLLGSPFETVHFEPLGFGGTRYRLARALRGLADVPLLREFFAHAVFAVARKPAAARPGETRTLTSAS